MPEKKTRTLLFWSRRVERFISKETWDSGDRIVEVPDDISATIADDVAKKLTALMHEELALIKQTEAELRIIPLGPPTFQDILEHVISTQLTPVGGGWTVIRSRPVDDKAPSVIIDQDTASRACARYRDPNFNKPADNDKRLYNDDLPPTLERPAGH